ncbi:hypothetical protein ACRZ5S_22620 (plasmid) [Vibrio scophthalmi]|uniref:hypothetical protein n=1 Tax=Vibrio scophthalmi TaxID=45658 RepID=UPI003EB9753F
MTKRFIIGLSILAFATSNAISFWAGQNTKGMTIDPAPIALESLNPSQKQIEKACYQFYVRDVESDQTTKVQLADVQGKWLDINSSYLCAIKSNLLIKHDNGMVRKPLVQTFFVLREEFIIKPLSESEFKKLADIQS